MWDLIIQNNASKKLYLYRGLVNNSSTNLYVEFDNFELLNGEPDGEYSYWLIYNGRDDVVYELAEVPLNTVLHTGEGDITLKDLHPKTGILRIGRPEDKATYRKNNEKKEYLYRKY